MLNISKNWQKIEGKMEDLYIIWLTISLYGVVNLWCLYCINERLKIILKELEGK